jgi:hypothetical protein
LSGLAIDAIPIRDLASFNFVLGDATVELGSTVDADQVLVRRFRFRENEAVTQTDLDDYLRDDSRYFRMFRPFIRSVDMMSRLLGGEVTVARGSFVHQATEEQLLEHLKSLTVELESERVTLVRGGVDTRGVIDPVPDTGTGPVS